MIKLAETPPDGHTPDLTITRRATALGLCILPLAYGLIAWGAIEGYLAAVLAGTLAASSACYGFIYLGGLSGVLAMAKDIPNEASAGYFLMAYIGFSLPVVVTGVLVDTLGHSAALTLFGGVLLAGVSAAALLIKRSARYAFEPGQTAG